MLCDGRPVPDRADVTAADMGPVLDHAFILERIAPGSARLRLAGRQLVRVMGGEVRGMPISALLNPPDRGRFADILESVFQGPQLADLALQAPDSPGQPPCSGRLLLLPLRSDLGDVSRILGCLALEGRIGSPPQRFDLIGEYFAPVIKGRAIVQPAAAARPDDRAGQAGGHHLQGAAFAEWGHEGRPHAGRMADDASTRQLGLQLVVDNERPADTGTPE